MKFSMNGWRHDFSNQVKELRDVAHSILNDDFFDADELRDVTTRLICMSNSINCVYIDGDELFSDMSDLEVAHLDEVDQMDASGGAS